MCGNHAGEFGHVADKLQAFLFGVADVVDVIAASSFLRTGNQRGVEPPGERDAGSTAFRDSQNGHVITQAFSLVRHQNTVLERVEGKRDVTGAGG